MRTHFHQQGFSILEIAVVILVLGLVLASVVKGFARNVEQAKIKQNKAILEEIKQSIWGFVALNGRLPCPSSRWSKTGKEEPVGGGKCSATHGFIPRATLGLQGKTNTYNQILDAWNSPIRYSFDYSQNWAVTTKGGVDSDFDFSQSFLIVNDVDANCNLVQTSDKVVAMVYSLGKDGNSSGTYSNNEKENVDNDKVFISTGYKAHGNPCGNFNDTLVWISVNQLVARLTSVGKFAYSSASSSSSIVISPGLSTPPSPEPSFSWAF